MTFLKNSQFSSLWAHLPRFSFCFCSFVFLEEEISSSAVGLQQVLNQMCSTWNHRLKRWCSRCRKNREWSMFYIHFWDYPWTKGKFLTSKCFCNYLDTHNFQAFRCFKEQLWGSASKVTQFKINSNNVDYLTCHKRKKWGSIFIAYVIY